LFYDQRCPWIVHLAAKILKGDPLVNDLLDPDHGNPFFSRPKAPFEKKGKKQNPPEFVRAMLYEVNLGRFILFFQFAIHPCYCSTVTRVGMKRKMRKMRRTGGK
jgi:hypothetical protein